MKPLAHPHRVRVLRERAATHPLAGRLGRHVEHDPRSRGFAAPVTARKLVSTSWSCHAAPFDQLELGSCTGNAMGGLLMTEPFFKPGRELTEDDCVRLYEQATRLDRVPGHYPPDDTGSSGLAVARAAQHAGFIRGYRHAFGLRAALYALTRGPVITGVNWYEGFDKPVGANAKLVIAGDVRGGHEFELLAIDVERSLVRMRQSWGPDWGDHGYASIDFATFERLLEEDGDVVVPEAA